MDGEYRGHPETSKSEELAPSIRDRRAFMWNRTCVGSGSLMSMTSKSDERHE